MSSTDAPTKAPARARPTRAQEDQQRRRRRDPNDNGVVKRLGLPESKLDREQYQYRWVVDTPGRVDMLYQQDWDLVGDEELGASGYTATRHADVAQNRLPLTHRLMRKPKTLFEEDHQAKQKALDEEMRAAELGRKVLNGPDHSGASLDANDPRVYSPDIAANKL